MQIFCEVSIGQCCYCLLQNLKVRIFPIDFLRCIDQALDEIFPVQFLQLQKDPALVMRSSMKESLEALWNLE